MKPRPILNYTYRELYDMANLFVAEFDKTLGPDGLMEFPSTGDENEDS